MKLPCVHSPIFRTTQKEVPYLREPGVVVVSVPHVDIGNMQEFLAAFDSGFEEYIGDATADPPLSPSAKLCKTAGQLCYMSFGKGRSYDRDAARYFENILDSKHGSVLEHANISCLFYGISRSVTHELVRHRAGFGFSQVSQRYVSGRTLRFVERVECTEDSQLHARFEAWVEQAADEYEWRAARLLELQREDVNLADTPKTELRKRVNQVARGCLPNETEAPIVVTANVRAWRHFLEMRASSHADTEIQRLGYKTFLCLRDIAPELFRDYTMVDGRYNPTVSTKFAKV